MSIRFIRLRKNSTSAPVYEVPIGENHGISLVSLNRLVRNVQHLAYVTDEETIRITTFENGWFFAPDVCGWRSDITYFAIVDDDAPESSPPSASGLNQDSFSPDRDLTFSQRLYRWWCGTGYKHLKSD